jgi:tRNA threonylcarbamoyladenosine biosynthesis protein TsaB
VLAALDTGRNEIHAALYDELGAVRYAPAVMTLDEAAALAASLERPLLAGTAAQAIAARLGERSVGYGPLVATADIAVYAGVAAAKGAGTEKPKPLYLRAPDAKPQASFVLPRAQE